MDKLVRWVEGWAGRKVLALLFPVALFWALDAPASAAVKWPTPPSQEELRHMTEAEALAALQRVYLAQRALRSQGRAGQLDTTPPVLTRFDAGPELNVTKQLATAKPRFEARDDKSGVYSVYVEAFDDKRRGGFVYAHYIATQPAKRLAGVMASINREIDVTPPGTYTFAIAWVTDAAGNIAVYDRAALSALGNTTLEVRNPQGFDVSGPTLVNGIILTPELSLSDHHPGTDQPPFIAVTLGVEETGGTVISGPGTLRAWFCQKEAPDTCLIALDEQLVPHQSSALLTLARQLGEATTPGVYHLSKVQLIDLAGNYTTLTSSDFGGDTDFSRYFPSTTITIMPGAASAARGSPEAAATGAAPPQTPCSPEQLKRAPAQKALRAQGMAEQMDVTPPVLTRFDAVPDLNVTRQLATPRVRFEAMDDKSGIVCILARANGPRGESALYVRNSPALPARHLDGLLADGGSPKDLDPPGVHTFAWAIVYDAAGNSAYYDAAALAALGNTAIKVRNPQGYDLKPPTLVSGIILTPDISLSDRHPGTDRPPYFSLKLGVEDRGNSMISGLQRASVTLCTLAPSRWCIYSRTYLDLPYQSSGLFIVAGQPNLDNSSPPGEYHICSVSLTDQAGSGSSYYGTECGGETDFSHYFPSMVITLRP